MHTLGEGQEYVITAIETHDKKGYSYNVMNIRRDKPTNAIDMQIFLAEILTPDQASVLYNAYPDIVDRVINNNLEDVDLNRTKGIKEFTFNKIKEKIIENFCLVDLVSEFQGLISIAMAKKLYGKYSSINKVRQAMQENPYKCLCGLARVGFKTADNLLLQIEEQSKINIENDEAPVIDFGFDLKTSKQRCLSCVLFLLEENEQDGHTKMNLATLKEQCEKMVPACSKYFVECVKEDGIYYNVEKIEVGLKKTYEIELYIADIIKNGLAHNTIYDFDVKNYRTNEDISLTDEQLGALDNLCKYNISILQGNAGVGKSQTTTSIIDMLLDHGKSFNIFAPTGKASKVIAEYTKQSASTIHRGLGYIPPDEWRLNENNKMNCDVLIIDEFSMVDIFLFKRVLDAIDFNRTKLLMIGDDAQIASVSCGNLLYDFLNCKIIPTTTLTKVFRYADGGLAKVATDVRNCKQYINTNDISSVMFFGNSKDYAFINSEANNIVKNVIAVYKKMLAQGESPANIQVLSAYNKGEYGSVALNNHIQKIANKNYGSEQNIKCGETVYYVGDIIIQKVNNYDAKVYFGDMFEFEDEKTPKAFIANGETGVVLDIGSHNMIIDFDGIKVVYNRDQLTAIGLGYSISIHKSQGSSAKIVMLVTPQAHTYMLNSNLVYVGLTRMKEKCFHFGSPYTVNTVIKKKENYDRQTFLRDILKTQNNDNS